MSLSYTLVNHLPSCIIVHKVYFLSLFLTHTNHLVFYYFITYRINYLHNKILINP